MSTWWRELLVVIPEFKVAYFALPKVANTSIKLAFAQLLGLDEDYFGQSDWPHSTVALGVHSQHLAPWPTPSEIDTTLDAMTNKSDEWLVFTVVRDPILRLVSAWESLVLLEDPHLKVTGRWTHEMTVSLVGEQSSIANAFQAFARSSQLQWLAVQDPHFIPQTTLLSDAPLVPKVFHLERLDSLERSLREHFACLELQGPVIAAVNERLLPRSLLDLNHIDSTPVWEIYAEDFMKFGYSPDYSRVTSDDVHDGTFAVRAALRVRDANRRIHFLWSRNLRSN